MNYVLFVKEGRKLLSILGGHALQLTMYGQKKIAVERSEELTSCGEDFPCLWPEFNSSLTEDKIAEMVSYNENDMVKKEFLYF